MEKHYQEAFERLLDAFDDDEDISDLLPHPHIDILQKMPRDTVTEYYGFASRIGKTTHGEKYSVRIAFKRLEKEGLIHTPSGYGGFEVYEPTVYGKRLLDALKDIRSTK